MNPKSVFLSLAGREVRCLVRDSKFIYLSMLAAAFTQLFIPPLARGGVQPYYLVPLIPAFALSPWGPNQFGLDGSGFARFVLSPQSMRTVLWAKQAVLAGVFLLHTSVCVTVLLASGTLATAEAVSAIGLAVTALFCFLSAGVALSCFFPWPISSGFGAFHSVVDALIGQNAVFLAAAFPSLGFWWACASLNELGLRSRWGLFTVVICLGVCVWWLAVRAAAGYAKRNVMAIQNRLMS